MTPASMDPRDIDLLRRVAGGTRLFKPDEGEATDALRWLQQVERLQRLRREGYIRMPEPRRYYHQPGCVQVGPCEVTAEGYDALERYPG